MALGMMVPAAFAATTTSSQAWQQEYISVGNTTTGFKGFAANYAGSPTNYMPIYYVNKALKNMGFKVTWDGTNLIITNPKVQAPSNVTPGSGPNGIYLNGTLVQKTTVKVAKDPAGGTETSYMPIYFVLKVLQEVGVAQTSDWNGTTLTMHKPVTALAITSAKQTAATKVGVSFNEAVPSGTDVTLTGNGINYNATVSWNADRTVATLDTGYNLPSGTYTVSAGSLSQDVTIATAAPSAIEVTTKGFSAIDDAGLSFKVVDQFGNPVTNISNGDFIINAFDSTSGSTIKSTGGADIVANFDTNGTGTATLKLSGAAKGDNVVVTITDSVDAVSKSVTIPVVGISKIATLSLGSASDNGSSNVNTGDTGVVLNYSATDAAGQSATFDPNISGTSGVIDGIQFVSSNPNVVNASTFGTDTDGNLTFTAGSSTGTATITAVNLHTGAVSKTTITVGSASTVSSFKVSAPSGMVLQGSTSQLKYTATDSFGNAIAQSDFGSSDQSQISFATSNPSVVKTKDISWDSSDNSLNVTPSGTGTATIYVYANGTLQNSINLSVNAAAYPVKVTGLPDFTTYFENGATESFDASDLSVTNQYNQAYTPTTTDTVYFAPVSGSTGVVTLSGTNMSGAGSLNFTGHGSSSTVTSAVYSVYVKDANNDTTNKYDFTVAYVPQSDIASYSVDAPTTLYDGANGYPSDASTTLSSSDFQGAVSLEGKTSGGQSVVLNSTDSQAAYLTSSNPGVVKVVDHKTIQGVSAGTATITAYDSNGNKLATKTVTVSDTAPAPKSVSFSESSVSDTSPGTAISTVQGDLSVTDQYGVAYPTGTGYWVSSNPAVIQGGSSLSAGTKTGTTTLTYLSSNGLSATISVTVK